MVPEVLAHPGYISNDIDAGVLKDCFISNALALEHQRST